MLNMQLVNGTSLKASPSLPRKTDTRTSPDRVADNRQSPDGTAYRAETESRSTSRREFRNSIAASIVMMLRAFMAGHFLG